MGFAGHRHRAERPDRRTSTATRSASATSRSSCCTPPATRPGSQCFLLDGRLVAGDTLFLEGCGRTDFPGGDADEMFRSLQALAQLPGDPTVFPGHWYSTEPSASLSEVRRTNYVYRASNLDQWRMLMGG